MIQLKHIKTALEPGRRANNHYKQLKPTPTGSVEDIVLGKQNKIIRTDLVNLSREVSTTKTKM